MTAHAMSGDQEKSAAAGMNDHVTKPIDPKQLYAVLARWISAAPPSVREERVPEMILQGAAGNAPGDSAPISAEVQPFPDALDGFDLMDGLQRLQGNKALYHKLLTGFATRYAKAAGDIRQALDAGDYRKAHGMIHDIKGLAGNLAALALQSAAAELEKLIKPADEKNPPPSDALKNAFVAFETRMDQALRSAQYMESLAAEPALAPTVESTGELPSDLAKEAAGKLREAAEMGDVSGLTAIAEDMASRSRNFAPYQRRIAQLTDDFDFEGILGLANELERMPG
ncbi:MAG: Hpt domain-containing protein, partial [Deltaproteobacteria bacterium]|nr:Hpt domain-containing protein [Deltaproteobacteria bacterium]